MSKSKSWKKPLSWLIAAVALVLFWFALIPYREARALQLVEQANTVHQSDPAKAIAILKEANFISRTQAGTIHLAEFEIEAGDAKSALEVLTQAKHHDTAYWLYQGKALLELNREGEAKIALAQSQDPQASAISKLLPLSANDEASRALVAGKLLQQKLPHSAERILNSGSLNSSGSILLAQLRLSLNENLSETEVKLKAVIINDPASVQLHELLRQTYERESNQKAASDEAAKIEALKSGKI